MLKMLKIISNLILICLVFFLIISCSVKEVSEDNGQNSLQEKIKKIKQQNIVDKEQNGENLEVKEYSSNECQTNLNSLFSTDELTLVEGPLECTSTEGMLCGIYKVRIESPNTPDFPLENPSLDDRALPIEAILIIRAKEQQSFCDNRWIVFDAGGYGRGYANTFGSVLPGKFEEGEGFGDDLIIDYTKLGYVTVDLMFEHPKLPIQSLRIVDKNELSFWALPYNKGRAWFRNLNNSSFLGSASRSRAVYDWAYQNSGDNKICAHAQSSGAGRLIGALTRLNSENLFDTVVFDGGPVFAYMPWICAIDDGILGERPEKYFDTSITSPGGVTPTSISCAHTEGNNENSCSYDYCFNAEYDEEMLEDSFFVSASDRDFSNLDIGIVMGGADDSNAFKNIMLWLGGYTTIEGEQIPYLTANSITLKQGYCENSEGTYLEMFPCSNWDVENFPSVSNTDTYDISLINSEHGTTETEAGMNAVKSIMLDNCEIN